MIVDFTKYRRNTLTASNRYIAVCPKCGKKGERQVLPSENSAQEIRFIHKMEQSPSYPRIVEKCTIINEVTAK